MASPISRQELTALESLGRGTGSTSNIEETVLERLEKLGMAELRGGKWLISKRGQVELQRRKALGRQSGSR